MTGQVEGEFKQPPAKSAMVQTFRAVAVAAGYTEKEASAITGHVLRSAGAQYMARLGVEYYKIQLFCRWGSETILRYLRDSPLEESEKWLNEAAAGEYHLRELVQQAVVNVGFGTKGLDEKEIWKVVEDALSAGTSDILSQATLDKEEIENLLQELRTKKLEMEDQWAEELSRKFLPKYVMNLQSRRVHAVRDAYCSGCGYDFRNSRDYELMNQIPEGAARCETPGCMKLFDRYA